MRAVSARALISTFLRSFTIQGSWNYRTMIGGGFAFSMVPVLRYLFPDGSAALRDALSRHAEHFNAHPYMAGLALGAATRLEADGADPEMIRRFKNAIRGPLGGVGDHLVWAAWLPTIALLALVLALLGASPWWTLGLFMILYNGGHVGLRIWGFRTGLKDGRQVAEHLKGAGLSHRADGIRRIGVVLLGAFLGALLTRAVEGAAPAPSVWVWIGLATATFLVGTRMGRVAWGPTLGLLVGVLLGTPFLAEMFL